MKEVNLFGTDEEVKELEELKKNIYTAKIQIPQYIPSDVCPSLSECVNLEKYESLIDEINKSNASPEEKTFLKLAATRHIRFSYDKIADYYAHSSKDIQKLFENSALVIIDIDDAIAQGYVRLSTRLDDLMGDSLDG